MDTATKIERVGDAYLVLLSGEIDAFTAPSLRDDFHAVVAKDDASVVIVDLSAVTFLDSSALGALVGLFRRLVLGPGIDHQGTGSRRLRRGRKQECHADTGHQYRQPDPAKSYCDCHCPAPARAFQGSDDAFALLRNYGNA